MPVCSYLVFPRSAPAELAQRLRRLPGCEVTPADNADLLILVTDTADDDSEQTLQQQLRDESDIQCMVLTFGDIDDQPGPQAGRRKKTRPAMEGMAS